MKISKKTIIIIVIVVAVVAYLIYKNKERSTSDVGASDTAPAGTDVNNIESVIAASGMTSADAGVVRRFAKTLEASTTKREYVQSKADQRGLSLAQMAALEALWGKYCTMDNGTSVFKPEYRDNTKIKNYYWKLVETIRDLY